MAHLSIRRNYSLEKPAAVVAKNLSTDEWNLIVGLTSAVLALGRRLFSSPRQVRFTPLSYEHAVEHMLRDVDARIGIVADVFRQDALGEFPGWRSFARLRPDFAARTSSGLIFIEVSFTDPKNVGNRIQEALWKAGLLGTSGTQSLSLVARY